MQRGPFLPSLRALFEFSCLHILFVLLFCGLHIDVAGAPRSVPDLLTFYGPLAEGLPFQLPWFAAFFIINLLVLLPLFFLDPALFRRYFVAQGLTTVVTGAGLALLDPNHTLVSALSGDSHTLMPYLSHGLTAHYFIRTRASGLWGWGTLGLTLVLFGSVMVQHQHPLSALVAGVLLAVAMTKIAETLPNRWGRLFNDPTTRLPPGPGLGLIPSIQLVVRILLHPYDEMLRLRDRYGNLIMSHLITMGDVVITGDPQFAHRIFKLSSDEFDLMDTPMVEHFFGPHSIFVTSGAQHKETRKFIMPHFKAELMKGYAQIMNDCTLAECSSYQNGEEITFKEVADNTTVEILMMSLFGITVPERIDHMKEVFQGWNNTQSPLMGLRWIRQGSKGPNKGFQEYNIKIRALINELIHQYRAEKTPSNNILSLLVKATYEDGSPISEDHVTDTMITLLVAGFAATAFTTCWAFERLHRHPDILAGILSEIDALPPGATPDDLTRVPRLDAFCHEVIRHFPPIENGLTRRIKQPLQLGEYTIPAGTGVTVSATMINMNPDLYPDPHRFDPERFLGKKPPAHEMASFGGGVRLCVGYAFARYQLRVVLGTALRHYRFEALGPGTVPTRYSTLTGPKGPCPARIFKR